MGVVAGAVHTAIAAGVALMLAALGELLAERAGVMNLGLEGVMALGALTAVVTVTVVPSPFAGLAAAIVVGLALGCVFGAATVKLRANQILCGLALVMFGVGLAGQLGRSYTGPTEAVFTPLHLPVLGDIPYLGAALFEHDVIAYATYLVLPLGVHHLLHRTRHGMDLRAVGENPGAAEAAGVPVTRYRFLYVCVGSAMAAAGGAYLTLAFTPSWTDGVTASAGWIALAIVIFAHWRPLLVIGGALLYGGVTSLGFVAQGQGWGLSPTLLSMLPYLVAVLLLVLPALARSPGRRPVNAMPSALGVPYEREER